jgi:hypothetical protein
MEEEYEWNISGGYLRLDLTRSKNGRLIAQYKSRHGNILHDLEIIDEYGQEKIAKVVVYKDTPDLTEFTSGGYFTERNFRKIKSASIPKHRHSEGLKELIKMIEDELVPQSLETTKAN